MKKTITVNVDKIPDEYKSLVKPEMSREELAVFGTVLFKMKINKIKQKIRSWFTLKKT